DCIYCPHCGAEFPHPADVAGNGDESARRQGGRDLAGVGLGLIALGFFGLVGAVLSVVSGRGEQLFSFFIFGSLLLLVGGLVVVLMRPGASGASAFARGCATAAVVLGLGAVLVLAAIGYAFLACVRDLNRLGH